MFNFLFGVSSGVEKKRRAWWTKSTWETETNQTLFIGNVKTDYEVYEWNTGRSQKMKQKKRRDSKYWIQCWYNQSSKHSDTNIYNKWDIEFVLQFRIASCLNVAVAVVVCYLVWQLPLLFRRHSYYIRWQWCVASNYFTGNNAFWYSILKTLINIPCKCNNIYIFSHSIHTHKYQPHYCYHLLVWSNNSVRL